MQSAKKVNIESLFIKLNTRRTKNRDLLLPQNYS